ncbi:MAG: FAD-dependent oxidoreductase [Beijerinckiaceae bacterium]|jgi:D-amino-acid dehydrogenase|nr:FAD-dependent oxidoreductase [Beijerinckiaceae bacterium]
MHVLIIGAGITGTATAHALLDEGHTVTLIDPDGSAARERGTPSAGNAGWIATADILPLAHPKIVLEAPRMLLDPLGPLAIRAGYLLPLLPWLARFLWASRPSAVAASTRALIDLQTRALPAWLARARALGLEKHIHRKGGLYMLDTPSSVEKARIEAKAQREAGINVDVISLDEARQMEPAIRDVFAGALFHADSAHISDPLWLTTALFEAAIARGANSLPATVRALSADGKPAVLTDGGVIEADAIVLAAGIWSRTLAAGLGDKTPLDTERGYNVSFKGVTGLTSRPIAFKDHGFIINALDSGIRIGGAVEFGGLKAKPNHARTRALYEKCSRFISGLPDFGSGDVWMGFRPSLPDSLPVIGPSRASPRIIYAFGHGHLGMTQSHVTAGLVADMIAGRKTSFDATPFSAQRF